jgi:hypothetical protein
VDEVKFHDWFRENAKQDKYGEGNAGKN